MWKSKRKSPIEVCVLEYSISNHPLFLPIVLFPMSFPSNRWCNAICESTYLGLVTIYNRWVIFFIQIKVNLQPKLRQTCTVSKFPYASCLSLMMKSKFCDFKFFSFSVGVPMKQWHCTYKLIPKWLPCGFWSCKVWPNTKPVLTGGSRIWSKGGVGVGDGGYVDIFENFDNPPKIF